MHPGLSLLDPLRRALAEPDAVIRLDGESGPPAPPGTAVVVRTSGSSSGMGRPVALSADALHLSAAATADRLVGPGQWLLALPVDHIAGIQVLVRSLLAGTEPVALPLGRFEPQALAAAIGQMRTDVPRYVSLVPTQLHRVMTSSPESQAALASCAAVLLGGAASEPALVDAARAAGITVVRSYGMTETCGGCVYDGEPLAGVQVRIESGRVLIAGGVLATGYLDDGPDPFVDLDSQRWLRTSDAGRWDGGRLQILGRIDDVIVTGGVNVHPGAIENALAEMPQVAEVAVVGVPDPQWGQLVTAVLLPAGDEVPDDVAPVDLSELRATVAAAVAPGAAVPRAAVSLARFPMLGSGKVDRRTLTRLAAQELAAGRGQLHR